MEAAKSVSYNCTMLAGSGKVGTVTPIDGGYYEVPLGAYDAYNSMGMFYDGASAVPMFNDGTPLMRKLNKGILRGEWKHPKRREGSSDQEYIARIREFDDDREAFHVRKLKLIYNMKDRNGNNIILVVAELKPSGPYGHLLKEKLDNPHENVYFSVRSLTMDDLVRRIKYTREIVTWDYVGEGGIYEANKYNSPSLEDYEEETVAVKQHQLIALREEQKKRRAQGLEDTSQDYESTLEALGWNVKQPSITGGRPAYMDW